MNLKFMETCVCGREIKFSTDAAAVYDKVIDRWDKAHKDHSDKMLTNALDNPLTGSAPRTPATSPKRSGGGGITGTGVGSAGISMAVTSTPKPKDDPKLRKAEGVPDLDPNVVGTMQRNTAIVDMMLKGGITRREAMSLLGFLVDGENQP